MNWLLCLWILLLVHCGESKKKSSGGPIATPKPVITKGSDSGEINCDNGTQLTFDTYGNDFFNRYCRQCHESSLKDDKRFGASVDFNFDSYEQVLATREKIIEVLSGSIPKMPPSGAIASYEQNIMLEWLICGAPN